MNREIKFRAWDNIVKSMFNMVEIISYKDGSMSFQIGDSFSGLRTPKDAIIMQYTGLKDKNGKEIYEGDILLMPCGGIIEIFFDVTSFNARVIKESAECTNSYYPMWYFWDINSEVIGNIYENPELLTK